MKGCSYICCDIVFNEMGDFKRHLANFHSTKEEKEEMAHFIVSVEQSRPVCSCGQKFDDEKSFRAHCYKEPNKMPEGQGKRDIRRPRHDYIPVEFIDELASIFEEGRKPRLGMPDGYGDSWKAGGEDFLIDCLNHASNHLHKYMNGDRSENHLAKVAWNTLVVAYHRSKVNENK